MRHWLPLMQQENLLLLRLPLVQATTSTRFLVEILQVALRLALVLLEFSPVLYGGKDHEVAVVA